MYIYIKAANSYRYQDQQEKLERLVRDYVEALRQVQGLNRSQLNSRIPALRRQRERIWDLAAALEQDQDSINSMYDALNELIDSGLRDIPTLIKGQLRQYGIPDGVVRMNNLKVSDFKAVDNLDLSPSNGGKARFESVLVSDEETNLPTGGQWWTLPKNLKDALKSQISKIAQRSGISMCEPIPHVYLTVSGDNYRIAKRAMPPSWYEDLLSISSSNGVDSDHVILYIDITLEIGRDSQDIYTMMSEFGGSDWEALDAIDDLVIKGKVSRAKVKSASSEWSKTIDLRDYFPEECFDEDGEFDGSLASENDWINFNLYEVQHGFGDTKNLYSAVLTKAGFPAYTQLVSDPTVDNEGNLEFIMYGDEGLEVPDIRFGFDMDTYGDEATVSLTYANAAE